MQYFRLGNLYLGFNVEIMIVKFLGIACGMRIDMVVFIRSRGIFLLFGHWVAVAVWLMFVGGGFKDFA